MATYRFEWNPWVPENPGPCIKISVTRYIDEMESGKLLGLEYDAPSIPNALIDTGSPFTFINTKLAKNANLFLTNPEFPITTVNGDCVCEEYGGSISFPGSGLPPIRATQILAKDLSQKAYACILGRNILKRWNICFDGQRKTVTITAPDHVSTST
jgi:predicted aspartyl protease